MTLSASGLTIHIGTRTFLSAAELRFGPSQIWAVLGRNGAGKSLLLHTLAGLRAPQAGTVAIDGRPLTHWRTRLLAQQIGLLLQDEPAEYWGTVREYVALGRLPHHRWQGEHASADPRVIDAALEAFAIDALARERYRTLSGGERQRARLAQLIAQDTPILLLDEPLNHLDLAHQAAALERLALTARSGRTVVCTVHDPVRALRYCSHALLLYDSGRFEQGAITQVVTRSNLAALYECPVEWAPPGTDPGPLHR